LAKGKRVVTASNADIIQDQQAVGTPPPARARVVFDPAWCRTCRVCEVMCSTGKESTARPALARIHVLFDEFQEENPISGSICFQCADAPCIEVCPKDALVRDERTGALVIVEKRCIGCMLCQKACPWDIPRRHPDRKVAIKCDLCVERADGPLCVEMCPLSGKALRYEEAQV
jgi:Fe-S-cluster-containing dehydrogenase component